MYRILFSVFLIVVIFVSKGPLSANVSNDSRHIDSDLESELKAAIIFKLIHYVDHSDLAGSDIQIGVCAEEPVFRVLQELSRKEMRGNGIHVVNLRKAKGSQEKFNVVVCGGDPSDHEIVEESMAQPGVLTIGFCDEFLKGGGMVHLYSHNNRIRFDLNLGVLKKAGLSIRSSVIRLARNVIQ